jgi:hypothetical protein
MSLRLAAISTRKRQSLLELMPTWPRAGVALRQQTKTSQSYGMFNRCTDLIIFRYVLSFILSFHVVVTSEAMLM